VRIPRVPHRWNLTPREAIAVQRRLARRVIVARPRFELRLVAGLDAAFSRDGSRCVAGVVLWDRRERRVLEEEIAWRALRFPYVPGLLSFREAPALLAALRRLRRRPDALVCDGHGLAHPRRFGIACHGGVLLDLPTVGCAKSRLVGCHAEPGLRRGSRAPLVDRGEEIGAALRTRAGVRPVYVSVGHRIDQAGAEALVLDCALAHRLPEPTRLADRLVARARA
jgi:deoxyribonuclease V